MRNNALTKALRMILWQGTARVGAFAASIWAARCLGPENLGISTMVTTTIAQLALLVNLNQNNALIRSFRLSKSEEERGHIIHEALSFRLLTALATVVISLAAILLLRPDSAWTLALLAGIPLLVSECNQPAWLLQARDIAPIIQRTSFLQSAILLVGYAIFLRPGASAGTDLMVTILASAISGVTGWYCALRGYGWRISADGFRAYLLRIRAGRWLIVSGVSNYLYNSSFISFVGYLVTVKDAGLFRVASGLSMQLAIITVVGQQLLFPRFIDLSKENPEALKQLQARITRYILLALPLAMLGAYLCAEPILPLIYSSSFKGIGLAFTLLIGTRFFAAAASVYAFGLWAQNRDERMAGIMTMLAVFSVVTSLLLIPTYGINGAALAALLSETASFLLTWHFAKEGTSLRPWNWWAGKPKVTHD